MLAVGLTGGICSGKTAVSDLFAKLGVPIIDADIIAREVTRPNQPAFHVIIKHFSDDVLTEHGQLDRKKLREIIFNNATERKWLEALLHPIILKTMADQIKQLSAPYCIAVIPLLVEVSANQFIQRQLVVDVLPDIQIARLMQRDQISKDEALAIINAQASREERLKSADDVIQNNGNMQELERAVALLHKYYLSL